MTIFLQATFEGLSLGAIYSLVAIGFVLIYKATDVLSFAQPALAVVGAGIVGICCAYFLKKSGLSVTLIDREDPGTMTSFGHACSFADYANVPVNYPGLIWDIPKMLLKKDGPLAVDFFYILKNLPWALSFLKNCKKEKVDEIASSLTNLLKHSQISYDEIFKEVNVQEYISHEENLYLFDTKKSLDDYEYANVIRKNNRVKVSGQHYMWTLRDGWWQWIIADQLKVGDSLLNKDLSVEEITSKDFNGYGEYEVVNINVETEDVYFAADVLSHNKGTNSI